MAARRKGFTKFRNEEGEDGIRKLALEYATTNIFDKMEVIAVRNDISDLGLREAIAYAIEPCLISYQLCTMCKSKAYMNQALHISSRSEAPANQYYDDLFEKRLAYVKTFRDERVTLVVQFYIRASRFNLKFIADSLGYSQKEVNVILKNAIIFGVASDEEVKKITEIAIRKANYRNREAMVTTFKQYKEYRDTYKRLVENYQFYDFQVSTYDDVHFEDDAPSKEDLESRLEASRKALKEFEELF